MKMYLPSVYRSDLEHCYTFLCFRYDLSLFFWLDFFFYITLIIFLKDDYGAFCVINYFSILHSYLKII